MAVCDFSYSMKVIHYIPSIDRASGGVGSYMQLLAAPLGRLVELHIVTHRSDNPLKMEHAQVHTVADWRHPQRLRREWLRLLDEVRPDVVHVNTCWVPSCAMVQRWAQARGYRVVLSPHGMLEPWILRRHYWTRKLPALLLYQRGAVRRADLLHATAESERENLTALGWNTRIGVVANGVDVAAIEMKHSWRRTGRLLFLSRVHPKKGVEFLLESMKALKNESIEILIAGEGEPSYIEELKTLAGRLGVADRVKFLGGVYGEEKWRLYREADLFVLPTHSENFGIVIAEALASGTPVVTTKGTPWHELETSHCGWWTEIGTQPTTHALRSFLALSEDELEQMGRCGRKLIEEQYSTEKIASDMVGLYHSLSSD